ncbi:c-type cytochrome biogenesis protein CcmI [soil metagenome]
MTTWLIFALMTAAVLLGLLVPFWRAREAEPARHRYDEAVFRDQLAELDRDVARGLIAPGEADAARNEISRRLIGAGGDAEPAAARDHRAVVLASVIAVPLIAGSLYAALGRPELPDTPLAARLEHAVESNDALALVAKVEQHLAKNPDDARGWGVIAPVYRQMRRYGDAALAYQRVLQLSPPTAGTMADYGEMLVYANEGLVDQGAEAIFAEALRLDPKEPKAGYFKGLALKQEGKVGDARRLWMSLLASAPNDAAWRPLIEGELAALPENSAPILSQDQIANAESMSGEDRQAMIRSMVDGLEERLKSNPADLEGWRRLIRSRMVLGDEEKARAAYAKAREQFRNEPDKIVAVDALARELRIE